eukprot:418380_1
MQRKHKRKRKKPKPNLSTKHNTKKSHMNIDTKKTKNVKRKITKTQPNIPLKSRNHLNHLLDNKINKYSANCSTESSVKKCAAAARIINALKYYEPINTKKGNNESNKCILQQYIHSVYTSKQLLNDFIHIKTLHNHKLEQMQKFVTSSLNKKPCNINHCISLARHNRDRNYHIDDGQNDDSKDDNNWILIRDTFDNIHSYLFHTFDLGLRIKKSDLKKIKDTEQDEKAEPGDCVDFYFKKITYALRKNNKKIKTFGRFKTNKYNIDNNTMATFSMEEKHQTARSWTDGL